MTTLPVSWVISIFALLACAAMLSQPRLPDGARLCFLLALVSTALASGFAGLRLVYGQGVWVDLQPHTAALVAPTFWLGFRSFMEQEGRPERHVTLLHGSLVILAQAGIALPLPWSADIIVTLVTATYTTLTASLLRCVAIQTKYETTLMQANKPKQDDWSFEISAPLYRWFLWGALLVILITNSIELLGMYIGNLHLSLTMLLFAVAGVFLNRPSQFVRAASCAKRCIRLNGLVIDYDLLANPEKIQ